MRPIMDVNGDCLLYGLVGTYVALLHPPTLPPGANSHGKLRRMLTGTGVGSIFRFVNDLEWQPAWGPSPQSAWWRRAFRFRATVTRLTTSTQNLTPGTLTRRPHNRARQARPDPSDPRNFPSFLIERPTDPPTNQLQASEASLAVPTHTHTHQPTHHHPGTPRSTRPPRRRPLTADSSSRQLRRDQRSRRPGQSGVAEVSRVAVAHTHSLTHFEIR